MKRPEEVKPILNVNLMRINKSYAVIIPSWFLQEWGMNPSKKYKIQIVEELESEILPRNAPFITILPRFVRKKKEDIVYRDGECFEIIPNDS